MPHIAKRPFMAAHNGHAEPRRQVRLRRFPSDCQAFCVILGPAAGRNPESRLPSKKQILVEQGWIPGSVLRTAPE
jgi:hypothetical protein